eukprot:189778-Rhodomonas_salina.1
MNDVCGTCASCPRIGSFGSRRSCRSSETWRANDRWCGFCSAACVSAPVDRDRETGEVGVGSQECGKARCSPRFWATERGERFGSRWIRSWRSRGLPVTISSVHTPRLQMSIRRLHRADSERREKSAASDVSGSVCAA